MIATTAIFSQMALSRDRKIGASEMRQEDDK
jgi:hypothetical protein